ncbi:MAG: polysaccharide biosynthesis protein [Clostridia bacterium]|nr:polysaccharide biosynthesis protein [Clostridia bacterium]
MQKKQVFLSKKFIYIKEEKEKSRIRSERILDKRWCIKIKKQTKQNSFMQGVVVLMFSQVIIKIVGLIYKLYLTNKEGFGDRGNAIYGGAFQIYAIFLTISSIGVPNAISKLVSGKVAVGDNKGAYRIFKIAFAIFGLLGFIGSSILFFGANYIANNYLQIPESEIAILALAPSVFLVSITSVLRGYFNGKENLSVTANSQSLEQLFKTLLTILIVEQISSISSNNTVFMAGAAALATTLATLTSLVYLYRFFIKRKKEVWQEIISSKIHRRDSVIKIVKSILCVSIPIALCALFSVLSKTIDAFTVVRILSNTIGEEKATLIYGILNGKVDTLITLPFSFNIAFSTALVPTISAAVAKRDMNIAKRRIEFSILVTILIGIPCSLCMCIFSKQILDLLFPNASSGAQMLSFASWTIIFVVLIQTINGALQGLGKLNVPVIAFAIGAIIKLIFNIVLMPIIGVIGAIISSILSHFVSFIICFISLRRNMGISFKINKFLIKPVIANIIMVMVTYMLYIRLYSLIQSKLILLITLLIGIIIYIMLIFMLKIFSQEEIFMIPYGQKIYKRIKKDKKEKILKLSKINGFTTHKT